MGAPVNFYSDPVASQPINFYSRPPSVDVNYRLYLGMNTDFTDATGRHTPVSIVDTMSITTLNWVFNGGSGSFGNGCLSLPSHADWALASYTSWTINFYVWFNTLALATVPVYFFSRSLNENPTTAYYLDSTFRGGGLYDFEFTDNGAASGIVSGDISLSTGVWYQWTLTKGSANDFIMYLNGASIATKTFTMSGGGSPDPLFIGAVTFVGQSRNSNIFIDEFSISDIVRIPGGQPVNFYSLP